MTRRYTRLALIGGLLATGVGIGGAGASAQDRMWPGFDTYRNAKYGFSLTYSTIEFMAPSTTPDGFQAVSKDGKARLLVGTTANLDNKTLDQFRKFILNGRYAGARLDYAPVRDTWFVVSGVKSDGTTAFYQRVNFVCGGRFINSWAVIFPEDEQYVYSNIIDQIHKDYRLGNGNCGRLATMQQPIGQMQPEQRGAMDPAMKPQPMDAMKPATQPEQMAVTDPGVQPTVTQPKQMAAIDPGVQPTVTQPKQMDSIGMGGAYATYNNDKHGFSLNYPTSQFLALPPATPDAFQATSKDGNARLAAGTIANFDGKSLGGYRAFLLAEAYPDAKLDDTPALTNGFVVSGVKRDGVTGFYHRVSFVCGGRNINSLVLTFRDGERPVYSPIIEQVQKDYRLGDGNCSKMAMMPSTN
jgi:hypothetical protein